MNNILGFILVVLWSITAWSNVVEMQEVRLAKAQIALAQGQDKEALEFISKNLNPSHFHRASYQFLVDYHLQNGKASKALKVLYYMAGKLHDKRVLTARFDKNFKKYLSTLGAPSRDALEVYFAIAEFYFELYNKKSFKKDFDARLLSLSQKYFEVAQYYRFDLPLTKIFLGKIYSEKENYHIALEQFMDAKELFKEEYKLDDDKGLEDVNLLIGTTMLQGGLLDPGSLYLRSVYFSSDTNNSTKALAQEYLNVLTYSFISATAKYTYGMNSNIYELNEFQLENYSNVESSFGPKDGTSSKLSGTLFYNYPQLTSSLSALFLSSFSQETYTHELHHNRNERIFTIGSELKYDALDKAIPKFRYYLTLNYNPIDNVEDFQKSSQTHYLEAAYIRTIKSGSLSYSIPLSLTSYASGSSEKSLGAVISYTPFWINKLFSPSISLAFYNREEPVIEDKSTRVDLSGGVQSEWNEHFSTFSNLVLRTNNNSNRFHDYKEYEFLVNGTWAWQWGLSIGADLSWRQRDFSQVSKLNVWTTSMNLALTY